MAPPRLRRPGFSRRAQYGLFAGYVVAVAGLFVALGLIVVAHFDPRGFAGLRSAAMDITSPVTAAARSGVRGVQQAAGEIGAYWDAANQNAALRRELAHDRAKLIEAHILALENRRLKRVAHLVEKAPDVVAVTRIIGSTAASARRLATLSAGASSGIRPGQPVRSPEGLIGRVIETGRISSRVLLLTDAGSTVPAMLVRTGVPVLATGHGDGRIDLRALVAGQAPFRRGDVVATSGTGGVYPPGIPLAVVTRSNRDSAVGWPLADPARVDFAIVLQSFEPDLPAPTIPVPER
jgi:rod shape-determining protein MreC